MCRTPLFIQFAAIMKLFTRKFVLITQLAFGKHSIVVCSLFTKIALDLMNKQLNACKCLGTAFFLIFAEEFNLFDHIFQNRIDLYVLSIVVMAIRARIIVMLPAINARFAE